MTTPTIQLDGITVRFDRVVALDSVSLTVPAGQRLAVVGENGAGKSTLMRVLFGLIPPSAGTIRFNGVPQVIPTPRAALTLGIGMVQQHFELIDSLRVAENITLGIEPRAGLRLDRSAMDAAVERLAQEAGLTLDPRAPVGSLSIAAQQRVEILKALYRQARVLILDEPTASLAPQEAQDLWQLTRRLSDQGVTILFVTHKLDDILAQAEAIAVLRQGKLVLETTPTKTTPTALATAMLGAAPPNPSLAEPATRASTEAPLLTVRQLTVAGRAGQPTLDTVDLTVHAGEIVGIAGVDGSGQRELIEAILGLVPSEHGSIALGQEPLDHRSPAERRALGLAYIPEDRHHAALVLPFSVEENALLGRQRRFATRFGRIRRRAVRQDLAERINTFRIQGVAQPNLPVRALSGGNQQKLVLARELATAPRLVLAHQPTRGLDFGATAFVHQTLRTVARQGAGVLFATSDLDELRTLADRIIVLFAGQVQGSLTVAEATEARLGSLMTGGAHG